MKKLPPIPTPLLRTKLNESGEPIIVGCNYHAAWQSHRAMRFVLEAVSGDGLVARLRTRTTKRDFNTDINSLIFIRSKHNVKKAERILATKPELLSQQS